MRDVFLRVRHGSPKHNPQIRALYAVIHDAETGAILVSSTLTYALEAIDRNNYNVVHEIAL